MPFEGGKEGRGADHGKVRVPNEGGLSSWEQLKRRRLQEGGWGEGPGAGEKPVRGGNMIPEHEAIHAGKKFEGSVTEVPFNAKSIRSKRWYLTYSLHALSMLQSMRFGKNIVLNFPETDLKQIYPVLQTLSRLPYLLHEKFKGRKYVSAREYDKAAKEMLNSQGDVFGKTGALQVVLAYWRAYKKMQAARKPGEEMGKADLILNIKMRKRSGKAQSGGRVAVNKPRGETILPKKIQNLPDAPAGLYEKVGYGPLGGGNLPEGVTMIASSKYNSQWEILKVYYKNGQVKEYRRRLK